MGIKLTSHTSLGASSSMKLDIHSHILPERWPDLKKVREERRQELIEPDGQRRSTTTGAATATAIVLLTALWLRRLGAPRTPGGRQGRHAQGRQLLQEGRAQLLESRGQVRRAKKASMSDAGAHAVNDKETKKVKSLPVRPGSRTWTATVWMSRPSPPCPSCSATGSVEFAPVRAVILVVVP